MKRATGGVRKRGAVWWIYYRVSGKQYDESAGTRDERVARALLARRRREIRDGTWRSPKLTVREYLRQWTERRVAAGVAKANDEARYFKIHVNPELGDMPLEDVQRPHVRDMMTRVVNHVSDATQKRLAPRTVLHIYRTLATAFADARDDGLILATPCTLRTRRGELPLKRDADPKWRAEAVYTREELEKLISSDRLPLDRRLYYALLGLAGMRSSEAAGITWSAYDAKATPLGRLVVATQAEDATKTRETKTREIRDVPVIPALAKLLAEWKLSGFPMLYGRAPQPDDPIVPSRASTRDKMLFRSKKAVERLHKDLERLKLRDVPSARHALRATFLSLLEIDGANMAIARRATHAAPSDVVGGYIRVRWEDVCREVGKLNVSLHTGAKVIALPVVKKVANDSPTTDSFADSRAVSGGFSALGKRGGRDLNPRPPA